MFPAFFGGEAGISGNRVTGGRALGVSFGPQIELYYLIAAYTFVCTALMFAFTLHAAGARAQRGARQPGAGRSSWALRPAKSTLSGVHVMAAFFAGISGGLAALNFEMVTTEVAQRRAVRGVSGVHVAGRCRPFSLAP
jgi:branched-chain amino acid transport system permease protein